MQPNSMKVYKIRDSDFVKNNINFESYVFVYQKSVHDIYGVSFSKTGNENHELEGLVKISCNDKCVYRKCIGRNIPKGEIQIGYSTLCELGTDYEKNVTVAPSSWFPYYWYNSDSYIKYPFQMAVVVGVITVLSFFLAIAQFFIR